MPDSDSKILKHIEEYSSLGVLPMHMPGHKRNLNLAPYMEKLGFQYDFTEIDSFDNLHCAEGILKESMERASRLWGSKSTYFLVNGSTCGILAAITGQVKRGEKVLMARNCHISVYNALELCGTEPIFVMPPVDEMFGIYSSLRPEDFESALERNSDVKLVILTSPTYEGVISNVGAICEIAHSRGVPVLVDEAHGAHLCFSQYFAGGAVKAGADIVIQSLHKTLPSLTQTAAAHLNGNQINELEFKRKLSIFETSSPSYLLLSSIDGCIGLLETKGGELFSDWQNNLRLFDDKLKHLSKLEVLMHGSDCLHNHREIFGFDRSKILVSARNTAITGIKLMQLIRQKYRIELEMSSGSCVLAMTGPGDTQESLTRLADALMEIDASLESVKKENKTALITSIPKRNCSIEDALRSKKTLLDAHIALGKTSAEYIWAYPPGVPLLIPGEEIGTDILSVIEECTVCGVKLKSTSGFAPEKLCVIN